MRQIGRGRERACEREKERRERRERQWGMEELRLQGGGTL
jgi:hypothetical protein